MAITNTTNIGLPLAVWLVHDEYDFVKNVDNYISVTKLMRPLQQIILPGRIPLEDYQEDVTDLIARRLGHSIHDSIERSWVVGASTSLQKLGYPKSVIDRVIVNPTTEQMENIEDIIPVWLENRGLREITINGEVYTIGGKFDMVADGILNDFKSTSAYGWVFGTRDEENRLQMSLYRWIDAKRNDGDKPRVTDDLCHVNYIFTDWQKAQARSNPKYPQKRVEQKSLELLSLAETEEWIINKISKYVRYYKADQSEIPNCTDEELWKSPTKYKYFTDPVKAQDPKARSTKNFDSLIEANNFMRTKGKGTVITVPGEVKACAYCAAFTICEQRKDYFNDVQ